MYLIFNGQLIPETEFQLPLHNRAFQYNDGFFETIVVVSGKIRFWAEHLQRIKEAATILRLQPSDDLLGITLEKQILELASKNGCGDGARVKLKVWRIGAGLYTPHTNDAHWLLTAASASPLGQEPITVGICQTVRTVPSAFSSFKGINAPVYVLASMEKAERQLDDLILLSPQGHVAELTYSNLFWFKNKSLFTPALETGCINGVMRRRLLRWAREQKMEVREGLFSLEELPEAELVFGGNVTGFRVVQAVDQKTIPCHKALLEQVNKLLK